jgi:hypothetical protein
MAALFGSLTLPTMEPYRIWARAQMVAAGNSIITIAARQAKYRGRRMPGNIDINSPLVECG